MIKLYSANKDNLELIVDYDDDPLNPRIDFDNLGNMVCFHNRYDLGDSHDFSDKNEFLKELLIDTLGSEEKAENKIESINNTEKYSNNYTKFAKEIDDEIIAEIEKNHVILPVYLYDHSGLSISTDKFSCPWDSGQVGWIYASKDEIISELGGKNLTSSKRNEVENILKSEVALYNDYLNGETYFFELLNDGELIKSGSSLFGDFDEIKENIKCNLSKEYGDLVDLLKDNDRPKSLIEELREAKNDIQKTQAALPVDNAQRPAIGCQ